MMGDKTHLGDKTSGGGGGGGGTKRAGGHTVTKYDGVTQHAATYGLICLLTFRDT